MAAPPKDRRAGIPVPLGWGSGSTSQQLEEIFRLARGSRSVEVITLTGDVLGWDDEIFEEHIISEDERDAFERDGYSVMEVGEDILAVRAETPPDGTVTIQPKSDAKGRVASSGGHANFGYSGYFRAYVFLGGRRKTLVDFWTLLQNGEHHYATQYLKAEAETAIRKKIATLAGSQVRQIKGGYAFDPGAIRAVTE